MTDNNLRLTIDTTEKGALKFALVYGDDVAEKSFKTDTLSEDLLPSLEKFLKAQKVTLQDLKKIEVSPGPGPFSPVRSGVSVANALVLALGLQQKVVLPKYDRAPNITQPKK